MKPMSTLMIGAAVLALAAPATAQSRGDWTLSFGIAGVMPASDNGLLLGFIPHSVDDGISPVFTAEYFFADNWGVELLASLPFEHDISNPSVGNVASAKLLPPTISVNYHFPTEGRFDPFLGVGLNYTKFTDVDGQGVLAATTVDLEDTTGFALHAGFDYALNDYSAVRFDLRYFDLESELTVNGFSLGNTKIDPVVAAVSYVRRF